MAQNSTDKTKKTKKEAWKTESFDGALLFLLLHKRIAGDPNDFSAAEIEQNPLYNFDKYSSATFKRSSQTIANKVNKFEEKGTGLTKKFKECLSQVVREKADLFEGSDLDDFDEDYDPVEDKEEDEESLSSPLQDPRLNKSVEESSEQPPIDPANIISSARRSQDKNTAPKPSKKPVKEASKTKPKERQLNMVRNNIPYEKSLTSYCDGHYGGRMILPSDFSDATTFYVTLDGCKVVQRRPKRSKGHPITDPKVCYKRHGFDDGNIHIVTNQTEVKNQGKAEDELSKKIDYVEETIFELEKPCKPYFLDIDGNRMDKVYIEDNTDNDPDDTTEWMYFWIVDKTANEEEIVAASVHRSRKRRNNMQTQMQDLMRQMRKMKAQFDIDRDNGNKAFMELQEENEALKAKLQSSGGMDVS